VKSTAANNTGRPRWWCMEKGCKFGGNEESALRHATKNHGHAVFIVQDYREGV
jgi:hypothetical protein